MNDVEVVREAAGELARIRQRPCLVLNGQLQMSTIGAVRVAVGDRSGQVDIVLQSPGGCICCAYRIARTLGRRFSSIAVFVPLAAKSAAALLALGAHELILGDFGELGPLDAQFSGKQQADFPVDRSRLEVFAALDQLRGHAVATFDALMRTVTENSGMRADDVCRVATDFASRIVEPLYRQIDPQVLGESLRSIDLAAAYAERVMRRYRPDHYARSGAQIIARLVRGYPDHGFAIDREELEELGLPVREPTPEEAPAFTKLAMALDHLDEKQAVTELVVPAESADAAA